MYRICWRVFLPLALIAAGAVSPPLSAQYGESLRGAATLRERDCTSCHAVLGRGGRSASDLTAQSAQNFSPADFAAELWNHGPTMWSAMAREGQEQPELNAQDLRDIFAFLYAARFFDPSGDIGRGRRVFTDKQCHRCHALVRVDDSGIGPAVPDWPALTDPVYFLEAMWNHGGAMQQETEAGKMEWPALTAREVTDLLAYVFSLPDLPPKLGRLELGSPTAGMHLFDDLGCIECHSILDTDPDRIPLAQAAGRGFTITDLAVAMWNHQPLMQEWATETGKTIPQLEPGQMGQLLSYLMEEGFLDRRGNEKRGSRVFESRGCQACHRSGGEPLRARDWRATDMAAAVWRHGPRMRNQMQRDGVRWPTLSGEDIADLIAWLNTRQ